MAEFGRELDAIGVDFDGVIHGYSRGWHDGTIYDDPVPGALEALRSLMTGYAVFIFTSRSPLQVGAWLADRGFHVVVESEGECETGVGDGGFKCFHEDQHRQFWDERGRLLITSRKLGALLYIDDRALRFTGWDDAFAWMAAHPRAGAAYASESAPAVTS
jgi:hypothetical protein